MLGKVSTEKSECSREEDRLRIFAAVRALHGGFSALDRSVLFTMTEWLQRQLEEEMADALASGQTDDGHCTKNTRKKTLRHFNAKTQQASDERCSH
jgi:hypothetical protein